MQREFEIISPNWTASYLSTFLSAYHSDVLWRWTLQVQDEFIFPPELSYLNEAGALSQVQSMLNIDWGDGDLLLPRKEDFKFAVYREAGIGLEHLFRGDVKVKQILNDIHKVANGLKFDAIRLHTIAQMVRHHGLLLTGLSKILNDRGRLIVTDANDKMNSYQAPLIKMAKLWRDLADMQKAAGGLRQASERILAVASRFGYRLIDSRLFSCAATTPKERELYFRNIVLKLEVISRVFPLPDDRLLYFQEALDWYNSDATAQDGLQVVILEKRVDRHGRRKSRPGVKANESRR